eukprot:10376925-Lingulodinium_polyedra.AAC.1
MDAWVEWARWDEWIERSRASPIPSLRRYLKKPQTLVVTQNCLPIGVEMRPSKMIAPAFVCLGAWALMQTGFL